MMLRVAMCVPQVKSDRDIELEQMRAVKRLRNMKICAFKESISRDMGNTINERTLMWSLIIRIIVIIIILLLLLLILILILVG